jgi:hypothetical protein
MGMSKRARNVASITNRTTTFGIMGGLAPRSRIAANQSAIRNKARNQQTIPLKPVPGLNYMKGNNPMGRVMLSRNPQCSGGVGRTSGGGFAGCSPANNISASFLAGGGGGPYSGLLTAAIFNSGPDYGYSRSPGPNIGSVNPDTPPPSIFYLRSNSGSDLYIYTTNQNAVGTDSLTIAGKTYILGDAESDVQDGFTGYEWNPAATAPDLSVGGPFPFTSTF